MSNVALAQDALAQDAAARMARCQQLADYYDRYGGYSTGGHGYSAPPGKLQRELGLDLCRHNRFDEGIDELEQAIRLLGFTPPPPK